MTLCRLTYAVLPLALLSLNICVSAQESVNQAPVPQAPAGKINIVSETPGNLPAFETFKAEKNNNAAAEIKGAEAILQENSISFSIGNSSGRGSFKEYPYAIFSRGTKEN